MKKNNKGFSLVELIVVIAIMAILAAVAIPTFATFITRANQASDVDFYNGVEYAVQLAAAAEATKPSDITVEITDKSATKIKCVIGEETVEIEESDKGGTDTFKSDVASAIDWDYTFKSVNAASAADYELSDDGKELVIATQDDDQQDDDQQDDDQQQP